MQQDPSQLGYGQIRTYITKKENGIVQCVYLYSTMWKTPVYSQIKQPSVFCVDMQVLD